MKRLQKAAALVLALVVVFSASVVPAHAEEYVSRADIFSWIASQGKIGSIISQITGVGCPINEDGRHVAHSCVYDGVAGHYVCTCDSCGDTFVATKSELHDAYDSHVGDMPVNGIDSAGGFLWYPTSADVNGYDGSESIQLYVGSNFYRCEVPKPYYGEFTDTNGINTFIIDKYSDRFGVKITPNSTYIGSKAIFPNIRMDLIAPCAGVYTRLRSIASSGAFVGYYNGTSYFTNYHSDKVHGFVDKGGTIEIAADSSNKYEVDDLSDSWLRAEYTWKYPVYRVQVDSALDSTLYTPDTRPGTITGKYLVQNGDAYEDSSTTIINEDDNSIYNPVTNTTTNYDSWSYDYSTRTYTMTDNTNNSVSTVTYGDENITINEGGNTYNVYYGTVINNNGGGDDSGGNGGGSDSGSSGDTGIIAKLGEMLGTLVSGLLGGVTAFVSAVFDGLISLANVISDKFGKVVSAVLSWFAQIPELFAGFSAFLVAVFPFLPADVMLLLTFGLAAVVFIAIIKAIRR